MPFVDWKEEAPFKKNGLPLDTEEFWIGVLQYKALKQNATFALTCLLNPVSNAVVERIFSLVSPVKTKARHRMQLNILDAIMSVRAEKLFSIKGCKNFAASPEMLKKVTLGKVYTLCSSHSNGKGSNDLDLELFL